MTSLIASVWLTVATTAGAASMPQYELQDTFIYDNGRVEQLVSVAGDTLTWSNFDGRQYLRHRNFVVPLLHWGTVASNGARRVSDEAHSLWPLKPGNTARFRVLTDAVVQLKDGSSQRRRRTELWSCRVLAPAPITVPAGTFDAFEIRCERFSPRTMRILSKEHWYYSEAVGHYVARSWVDMWTGRRTSYALVATLNGIDANPRRIRSILAKL